MRLACHYLESKSIHPVDAAELPSEGLATPGPDASGASSPPATAADSEELQSLGPEQVQPWPFLGVKNASC
jgi:hypothetical protein